MGHFCTLADSAEDAQLQAEVIFNSLAAD